MRIFPSAAASLLAILSLSCHVVLGEEAIAIRPTLTHISLRPLPSQHCPPICGPELLKRCIKGRCVGKRLVCVAAEEANILCPQQD
ncbi:hypothetical protein B0H17DRAFT_1031341 [Mycena rosella]|uniref:Uncharacterized protein n=1 Tax=Mycena rosella TaxID=1033263 RepID=A0AAD7H039_MYCRO|nr:hypothetical protein B0H17DRAFT_1031341 [Mycena rosella]